MKICLLQESKFFLLLKEQLIKYDHVSIVTRLPADVVLLDDEDFTEHDVTNIVHVLKEEKVILITNKYEELPVLRLIDAGVCSILSKQKLLYENLVTLLERILNNHFYMPQNMVGDFIDHFIRMKRVEYDQFSMRAQLEFDLTLKQAKVASLMQHGHSNKEIATLLGISEGSVKVHISHIYAKLGTNERSAAIKELEKYNKQRLRKKE
ncbi:LuxR C-terminal-related transcriptional regulator [Ornithinibacillus sp. FSL M8-0202]|uniref:LuxR C-terminal-related transcriptional regulator n=1 Tax=Ornithinibacillus sp. FSL M8-0202 TaxID=2921616 RepID=UPI0030CD5EBB